MSCLITSGRAIAVVVKDRQLHATRRVTLYPAADFWQAQQPARNDSPPPPQLSQPSLVSASVPRESPTIQTQVLSRLPLDVSRQPAQQLQVQQSSATPDPTMATATFKTDVLSQLKGKIAIIRDDLRPDENPYDAKVLDNPFDAVQVRLDLEGVENFDRNKFQARWWLNNRSHNFDEVKNYPAYKINAMRLMEFAKGLGIPENSTWTIGVDYSYQTPDGRTRNGTAMGVVQVNIPEPEPLAPPTPKRLVQCPPVVQVTTVQNTDQGSGVSLEKYFKDYCTKPGVTCDFYLIDDDKRKIPVHITFQSGGYTEMTAKTRGRSLEDFGIDMRISEGGSQIQYCPLTRKGVQQ